MKASARVLVGAIVCAAGACGGGSSRSSGDGGGGDGPTTPTVLWTAPGLGTIDGVAFDGGTIYFAYHDSLMGALYSVPIAGGDATTLYPLDPHATGVAADASRVYFGAGAVYSLPHAGGTPTQISDNASTYGPLAVDAQDVYFIDGQSDRLARAPIGGGAAEDLTTSLTLDYALGATGATIVSVPNCQCPSTIVQQPLAGSQPLQLDAYPYGIRPVGVWADDTSAYVALQDMTSTTFSGYIESMPLAGGAGGDTIYVGPSSADGEDMRPQIESLIGYGDDLYVFSNFTGVNDVAADLVAVPKVKGGAPITLVTQLSTPMFIAGADEELVYYVARKSGHDVEQLLRVPRVP